MSYYFLSRSLSSTFNQIQVQIVNLRLGIVYHNVVESCVTDVQSWVCPNVGANVPGTGEKLVRLRTTSSPVPGT